MMRSSLSYFLRYLSLSPPGISLAILSFSASVVAFLIAASSFEASLSIFFSAIGLANNPNLPIATIVS